MLTDIMANSWGEGAQCRMDKGDHPHEAQYLKLDCTKAKNLLQWEPIWRLERALNETVLWYRAWHQNKNMNEFTINQINAYQQEHLANG